MQWQQEYLPPLIADIPQESLRSSFRVTALSWQALQLTGSAMAMGMVVLAQTPPMLLLLCSLLLQGVFASIGPWVIFVGVKLITKKLEKPDSRAFIMC